MGQVLHTTRFRSEMVAQHPGFRAKQVDVCRMLGVSDTTVRRWQDAGRLWAYDAEHPDGQYVTLASGRRRYNLERIWEVLVPSV